jgi:hypothetical protein
MTPEISLRIKIELSPKAEMEVSRRNKPEVKYDSAAVVSFDRCMVVALPLPWSLDQTFDGLDDVPRRDDHGYLWRGFVASTVDDSMMDVELCDVVVVSL